MTVFYKFLRPSEVRFPTQTNRVTFTRMLVPRLNDSDEKYCYVELPEEWFGDFIEDFKPEGEILEDRNEFPDSFLGLINERNLKFTIIEQK